MSKVTPSADRRVNQALVLCVILYYCLLASTITDAEPFTVLSDRVFQVTVVVRINPMQSLKPTVPRVGIILARNQRCSVTNLGRPKLGEFKASFREWF